LSSGQVTYSASAGVSNGLSQVISTVAGKTYILSYDLVSTTNVTLGEVRMEVRGSSSLIAFNDLSGLENSLIFVATETNTTVQLRGLTTVDGDETVTIDNISVREIDPLSVSIQMEGRMTYADEGEAADTYFVRWWDDLNNNFQIFLDTDRGTGGLNFFQRENSVIDRVESDGSAYSPGILVPFNIASRHGSTFINGAVDGTALTENTTPVALPDLSSTDLEIGHDFMGTIKTIRIWADDIGDAGLEASTT
jgi:hypothetical protein